MRRTTICALLLASASLAAPAPSLADGFGSLGESYRSLIAGGGVVSEGVGLARLRTSGSGSGSISIAGIPTGAVVERAFLYWGTYGGFDDQVTFAGNEVTGAQIGRDGDTCWYSGDASNYAFRADVTSMVPGNGSYGVSGVGHGLIDGQGASLVVIYARPEAREVTEIVLMDGVISTNNQIFVNLGVNVPLSFAAEPVGSRVHLGFGDGNAFFDTGTDTGGGEGAVLLNGAEILPENSVAGSDGGFWDDYTVNVPAGTITSATTSAGLTMNSGLDCFTWNYVALETQLPEPPVSIRSPGEGATLGISPVPVSGLSGPGTESVRLSEGTQVLAEVPASDGDWTAQVALADGPHTITATALDDQGAPLAPTVDVSFLLDVTAPTIEVEEDFFPLSGFDSMSVRGMADDNLLVSRVTVTVTPTVPITNPRTVTAHCWQCGQPRTGPVHWDAEFNLLPNVYRITATAHDHVGNIASQSITIVRVTP